MLFLLAIHVAILTSDPSTLIIRRKPFSSLQVQAQSVAVKLAEYYRRHGDFFECLSWTNNSPKDEHHCLSWRKKYVLLTCQPPLSPSDTSSDSPINFRFYSREMISVIPRSYTEAMNKSKTYEPYKQHNTSMNLPQYLSCTWLVSRWQRFSNLSRRTLETLSKQ